jgi:hypothetical protein
MGRKIKRGQVFMLSNYERPKGAWQSHKKVEIAQPVPSKAKESSTLLAMTL